MIIYTSRCSTNPADYQYIIISFNNTIACTAYFIVLNQNTEYFSEYLFSVDRNT